MTENNEQHENDPDVQKDSTKGTHSTYLPRANQIKPSWRIKTTLLSSPEGCILLIGVAMALLYSVWLAIKFLYSPDEAQLLVGLTATELLFGRATAMTFGYASSLSHWTVIPVCMILETICVLIFYPLFVFSMRHLLILKPLKKFFDRIQKSAEAHQNFVRKYGVLGLFLFVWFPFWMTGPAIGSAIGFLLGLPLWMNMVAVLSGTYIAILGWGLILHTVHQQVAHYSPYAAMIIMAVLVVIIIAGHFLQRTIHSREGHLTAKNKNRHHSNHDSPTFREEPGQASKNETQQTSNGT